MIKTAASFLILFFLLGCASQPDLVQSSAPGMSYFDLPSPYDSIAGIGRIKITLDQGRYVPTYKDGEGYYYQEKSATSGVFITFDKKEAWIYGINHKPEDGLIQPVGVIPALVPILMFPPGSITKVRELKEDFFEKIVWQTKPNQLPPTPSG
jgi:hypothetical protein